MPRPEIKQVTFSIDGREVTAPENIMLVDGAKYGDVEIPVFCYEPKLGQPVGACRMCLVEIEGIPKLQTACSTPVKDGMVVHTQTDRVKQAQQAVVEFLLINHPLDCPVCDKGGECPLQDISFGWGGGRSRFIEPKRHFEKPIALSPLIAIDRERCILCYRCVRFSQELSEDYQLVFQERGAHTFVGTFDGHPYVAPFSGNITELCPVGALTSQPYRFRARPWDIEGAGGICTLCPGQCNVTFTVRDERVLRVLGRDNEAVDDGWLCDRGRFAYQAIHVDERITQPMVRDGGQLRPVSWERALDEAAAGLRRAGGHVGVLAGGGTSNEEGFLVQKLARETLGTNDLDSRVYDATSRDATLALHDPALQATVADLEFAHTVLVLGVEPVDDMPILDLRIRKGVRRRRVNLAVASSRPSSLDANAKQVVRFAPGDEPRAAALLADALKPGASVPEQLAELVAQLRDGGEDVVVLYGERVLADAAGAAALVAIADTLGLRGRDGAGLLGVPSSANARGLREAGVLPFSGPGLAPAAATGRSTREIAAAAADGQLAALWLVNVDPLETHPERALWDAGLERASTIVAHAGYLTAGVREHATVVFPAESHAEHEGTVVHPDGRVQRLRQAITRVGDVRPGWWILSELAKRLGNAEVPVLTGPQASQRLFAAVPFYEGLTLDLIGGKGLRWVAESGAAAAWPAADTGAAAAYTTPDAGPEANGRLRLGTYRSVWSGPEVANSPALQFLKANRARVELSPHDAQRLGVFDGDRVAVGGERGAAEATVAVRAAVPAGSAFLESNAVEGPLVEIRKSSGSVEPPAADTAAVNS
ncbi:MAG TPA: NADH-quinone oxidoreductase subunit NuoG [Baekduia sp.]|uniref:NADH-quinone oxidoreductase subunit NuoG n=1 Tax=Baekduia sp. TaxID=2600305 RepID=UPI002D798CB1|nr:NADH-quinone oxidoreductase subunit NuoG [Baekduia sp.]HET6507211.1 NADH-quinone oxidoreductase subunit NuoG [Baekduia sp.]